VRRFSVDKRQYAEYRPKSKTILIQRGLDGQALIGTMLHMAVEALPLLIAIFVALALGSRWLFNRQR